ncbi:MAG: PQQ-dependent sugar dehydrogenase [Bryobacteraceae bacterium]|nr:PQQ-dependent sugar dehydrogenase [Bryobacteraceae bacterium]
MRTLAFCLVAAFPLLAQDAYRLSRVATGLSSPTEIETPRSDGTNRLFVVEQRGTIRIVQNGLVLPEPFLNIASTISAGGERGLLGLAFAPRFAANQRFYIYYTDPQGSIVISRMRVSTSDPNRADPASEEVLLRVAHSQFSNHNGGRLAFGPDGFLYAGLGDGGGGGDPLGSGQRLNTLLGKLIRIDVESTGSGPYTSPSSNPFVNRAGALPEIWAYGLRNPWRFSFDTQNGDLYIADVGQNALEEINFQPASSAGGENYGWNRTEGTQCYPTPGTCDQSGLTRPVFEYNHSVGVSVTGGYVYRGRGLPALQGSYIYADFARGQIWALRNTPSGWENQLLTNSGLQISAFGVDQQGEIYIASYSQGSLYRLISAQTTVSAVNAASGAEGLVPGSLATLYGSGIAPVLGIVQPAAFPLPTQLGNVSLTINGTNAPLLAIASNSGLDQINFQIPWELAGQSRATLTLTVNGSARTPLEIPLAAVQPEIFTVQQQPGAWTIWATGLGSVTNQPATGQASPASPLARTSVEVTATINRVNAPVFYSGLSPNFTGLYQVNVYPPEGSPETSEVVIRIGSTSSRPWQRRP